METLMVVNFRATRSDQMSEQNPHINVKHDRISIFFKLIT